MTGTLVVGSLVSLARSGPDDAIGLVVGIVPSNPSGGTQHWKRVQLNNSYYVWLRERLVGSLFRSDLLALDVR